MPEEKRPNILIFMADHYRGDMAPPYGRCLTPNLDSVYREGGVAFTNCFCASPHCCPSRATFHTGLYPTEHGVWNNVMVGNTLSRGLRDGVSTWSVPMAENGYRLYHSGKWHVSTEVGPQDFGWINIYGNERIEGKKGCRPAPDPYEWARYTEKDCHVDLKGADPHAIRGEAQLIREGYPDFHLYGRSEHPFHDEEVTSAAETQLKECCQTPEQPFVLYCGCLGPHDPYFVPQRFLDRYDIDTIELPENFYDNMLDKPNLYRRTKERFGQLTVREYKEAIRHFMAFCSYEDWLFGRLVRILKEEGRYDDTILLFLSDHGDYCGEHGLFAKGLPCFRSAYHVPLILRWPGVTTIRKERNIGQYVSLADFAPSILEMAGIGYEKDDYSGKSFVPLIREDPEAVASWKDEIYTQSNGNELYGIQRSIMTPQWKYVYNGFDYDELYNLKEDPYELVNVANRPENWPVIRQLAKKLWKFAYDRKDTCINPYIMVSLAEFGPGIVFEEQP